MRTVLHVGLTALLALSILANVGLATGEYLEREPAPRPLTAERIEVASRPAIVLVQTDYSISASLASMVIPDAKFNQIVDKVQAMWDTGQVRTNAQAYRAAIAIVMANPGAYFAPGDSSTGSFGFDDTGSGFFVNENGYFVTAAHVVTSSKADLRDRAVASYKEPDTVAQDRAQNATDLLAELGLSGAGVGLTAAQEDALESFWQKWVAKYLSIDTVNVAYHLGTGTVQTGDSLTANGARASVVSIDPTDTGHDVAIMKADLHGVPTLPLASGKPEMGAATYAIGYPGQGDNGPADEVIRETMATGHVQMTDTASGWTAYGTTAEFRSGASGGPVVGADGKVMGIVSYSQVDDSGNQVPGGGFFVPSQYIKADLAAASVRVTDAPGDITDTYYRALAEDDIQRYRSELPLLQSIAARTAFDAYIEDDVVRVQGAIATGRDRTPPDLTVYASVAAGSAGGVILITLLVWLALGIATPRPRAQQPVMPLMPETAYSPQALFTETEILTVAPPVEGSSQPAL